MRRSLPPHRVFLDLIELAERAIDTGAGAQRLIDILGRNAIGHQGDLERVFRAAPQAALAGKFMRIPKVSPGTRRLFQFVRGDQRLRPREDADAAFGNGAGEQFFGKRQARGVELFEQSHAAPLRQSTRFHLHDVPDGRTGPHHLRQLGDLAIIGEGMRVDTGRPGEWVDVRLDERCAIRAAERNHRKIARSGIG